MSIDPSKVRPYVLDGPYYIPDYMADDTSKDKSDGPTSGPYLGHTDAQTTTGALDGETIEISGGPPKLGVSVAPA